MNRLQISLARMMLGVALIALACAAARFTWSFARWLLLPSLVAILIAAWATLLLWDRRPLVLAGLTLGGSAGWLLEMSALILAGSGHGIYLPFLVFFGPFSLLPVVFDYSDVASTIVFVVAPVLYSIYGAAVFAAARSQWGPACFISILMFHYGLVAVGLGLGIGVDLSRFHEMWVIERWWMAAAVIFFAGIHAATALSLIAWRQRHRRGARL